MPRSLNRVTILGHLGGNAEIKHTGSGVAVANFSLATERRWKDKQSGEWKSETDWHRIVLWRAEAVGQYLTKGRAVLIEGRLQTRNYEDRSGEKRYVTEVVADTLILLGGPTEGGGRKPSDTEPDDDVPF